MLWTPHGERNGQQTYRHPDCYRRLYPRSRVGGTETLPGQSNTLGLIAGVIYDQTLYATVAVGLGAILGTFVLGRGALRRLTEGIFSLRYPNAFFSQLIGSATVELANQLGVPLSITETVSSG